MKEPPEHIIPWTWPAADGDDGAPPGPGGPGDSSKHTRTSRGGMALVAFVSLEEGSGKTMLAAHLGVIAQLRGAGPAAVIDTDVAGDLGRWRRARGKEHPVFALTFASRFAEDLARVLKVGTKFCAVDVARTVPKLTGRFIEYADLVVVPLGGSPVSMARARTTLDDISEMGKQVIIVLNGIDPDTNADERRRFADCLLRRTHRRITPVIIHRSEAFAAAMRNGRTVMETDPQGQAAREIGELWECLAERLRLPAS